MENRRIKNILADSLNLTEIKGKKLSKNIANCKNIFVIAETGRKFSKLPFLFMV